VAKNKPLIDKILLQPYLDRAKSTYLHKEDQIKQLKNPKKILREHPMFSHPKVRETNLLKISKRLDSIVRSNLAYYKNKQEKQFELKDRLRILSKDQSYKRTVLSSNIAQTLKNGELVVIEKIRKRSEKVRRKNYEKIRF